MLVSSLVQEGCVEGLLRRQSSELADPQSGFRTHPWCLWRAWMPDWGFHLSAVGHRRNSWEEADTPRAPDLRERMRPPDSTHYLDPSFQNTSFTNPAARWGQQIPCFFWTRFPLWTLYFYNFSLILTPHPLCLSFAFPATILYQNTNQFEKL